MSTRTFLALVCICVLAAVALGQQYVLNAMPGPEIRTVTETVYITAQPAATGALLLSPEDEALFATIVQSECGNTEPDSGVAAVAECLLNAMRRDELSVAEAAERYIYTTSRLEPTIRVQAICQAVLYHGLRVLDDPDALFFYAPAVPGVDGSWHETQRFVAEISGHRFFAIWE